jgi:hypothetical protein
MNSGLQHAVEIIQAVCRLAGPASLLDDIRADLKDAGIIHAVRNHDTPVIFDWILSGLSFQGISNAVAAGYMERHGRATWADIHRNFGQPPSCPKLASYWQFCDCRYHKGSGTCAEPDHLPACPLPKHRLRNGRLNQTAYSLFLFVRDIADGDLVAWLDRRLREADEPTGPDRLRRMREAVLGPLRHVYGASDKVLGMTLSTLLLGTGRPRKGWQEVGGSMIVVDSLVHNFLHRTGILSRLDADHAYGPGCYRSLGCDSILRGVAGYIDARKFNREFPATFPRFVQLAIWRYCAQAVFNVCNGNRIDDRLGCTNRYCRIYGSCDRLALHARQPQPA